MSTASDILRERATKAALDGRAHDAAVIAAVAELMDACVDEEPGRFQCRVCRSAGRSDVYRAVRVHTDDCKLAALERAITGENK